MSHDFRKSAVFRPARWRRFFSIALSFAAAAAAVGHPAARMHEGDLKGVFARIEGAAFRDAANDLSRSIDNELAESFRRTFGPIPGNHRLIGHGWTLGGAIPENVLLKLETAYPGRKGDIVKWWSREAKTLAARMRDATGLPPKQAQALAGLLWDIHLLGDRMPDNTLVDIVLPVRDIERDIGKNCEILFKGRKEYAKAIRVVLKKSLAKGGTDAEQAARMMECMQRDIPLSEMLSRIWGRTLGTKGIKILPRGTSSVTTDGFLKLAGVPIPKTFAADVSKTRTRPAKTSGPANGAEAARGGVRAADEGAAAARGGVRAANRAVRVFGAALPVVVETGFFFYDERKNREAFESGERSLEEMQCITYENVGKHGAALALGTAGASAGASYGASVGTAVEPGPGAAVGGVVGGIVGGLAGVIAGEHGGAAAGEKIYVSRAEKRAGEGDPAAMFFLGGYHYKRIRPGSVKHVPEALYFLENANARSEGGFPKADVFLGRMAWDGVGQATNRTKAVTLWQSAASLNDPDAMFLLARAYLAGDGIEQDIEAGYRWMRESASLGCELAIDAYPETEALFRRWTEEGTKARNKKRLWIAGICCLFVIAAGAGVFALGLRRNRDPR